MEIKEVQPEYRIRFGGSAFAVPGVVADQFLRLANAVQLKVLLCVLRHADAGLSPAQVAALLGMEEELVEEAFAFWMQVNVFESNAVPQPSAMTLPTLSAPAVQSQEPEAVPPPAVQRSSREVKLDPSEMADMLGKTPALKDLFSFAEKKIGRVLNHMEQRSLVWMYSYLNLPGEVILMLIGYCVSIEKFSMAYAEAIAISWEQNGINTLELAEEETERLRQHHTYLGQLCRMLEMKRKPTSKQMEFIEKWRTAGYSMELIHCAYEITVENTDKLNFPYMNKVLEGWAGEGITTPEQARQRRSAPSPQKSGRRKQEAPLTAREIEEMNAYLSLSNNFRKEESDE